MEPERRVGKYRFAAAFRDGLVAWSLVLELEDGEQVVLPIEDGEEVPILLDMCRKDVNVLYDRARRTLSTGWRAPGANS